MIISCKGLKIYETRIEIGLCFFLLTVNIISMAKTTDHSTFDFQEPNSNSFPIDSMTVEFDFL